MSTPVPPPSEPGTQAPAGDNPTVPPISLNTGDLTSPLHAATSPTPPRLGPPSRPGDLGTLGGYHVVRILGRGGMGVVYAAEDPRLGRKVALKVMTPDLASNPAAKARFLREARSSAAVEHDYIVPIYQVGEDDGMPFLAMPLLLGEALDDRLKAGPPLTPADVFAVARHTAEGLAAAHEAGLIHRDIKPSNLWMERHPPKPGETVGRFRRVRILDFGLARVSGQDDGLTKSGVVLGTPAYMAPEQARGKPVDGHASIEPPTGVASLVIRGYGRCDFGGGKTGTLWESRDGQTREIGKPSPKAEEMFRPGVFNLVSVRCVGPRVTITINNTVVADQNIPEWTSGGSGWRVTPGTTVRLRNIRFTDLSRPATDRVRKAAEVLRECGVLSLYLASGKPVWQLAPADPLPAEPFVVTFIDVKEGPELNRDATVAALADLGGLVSLVDPTDRLRLRPDDLRRLADAPVGKSLETLQLPRLLLTADAIDALSRFPALIFLNFERTRKDTPEGVALRAALPRCRIKFSEGFDDPTTKDTAARERQVAEALRQHHAKLTVRGPDGTKLTIPPTNPLTLDSFTITGIEFPTAEYPKPFLGEVVLPAIENLTELETLVDAGMRFHVELNDWRRLSDLPLAKSLTQLYIGAALTSQSLDDLKKFPKLTSLAVFGYNLDDAWIDRLVKGCPNLTRLRLYRLNSRVAQITPAGWERIATLPLTWLQVPNIQQLDIESARIIAKMPNLTNFRAWESPAITDELVKELSRSTTIRVMDFYKTSMTDAGLATLTGMTNLKELEVIGTSVTEAGVMKFASARKDVRIKWNGGVIEPTKK